MNDTYNPMLTIIDFLAVECLACVYPVPCTLEVNKRTALGVAACVVYDIAVREWPDLACQKVVRRRKRLRPVENGSGGISRETDRGRELT
jgi:hypothetical protein